MLFTVFQVFWQQHILPSHKARPPDQCTRFVPGIFSQCLTPDPFCLYPLLHCQRQRPPYVFAHLPVTKYPLAGGVNTAGHLRTEKENLFTTWIVLKSGTLKYALDARLLKENQLYLVLCVQSNLCIPCVQTPPSLGFSFRGGGVCAQAIFKALFLQLLLLLLNVS